MNDDEAKMIMEAIIDFWWRKVLDKMATENKDFEIALEEVKQEMLDK